MHRCLFCGQCKWQTWLNTSSYPRDLDDQSDCVSEASEALDSNITNNQNDNDELKIQVEGLEDEEEDDSEQEEY